MFPESLASVSRREALARCGMGMAGIGLGMLLGEEARAADRTCLQRGGGLILGREWAR